jgi:hypothetical protein
MSKFIKAGKVVFKARVKMRVKAQTKLRPPQVPPSALHVAMNILADRYGEPERRFPCGEYEVIVRRSK